MYNVPAGHAQRRDRHNSDTVTLHPQYSTNALAHARPRSRKEVSSANKRDLDVIAIIVAGTCNFQDQAFIVSTTAVLHATNG